MLDSKNMRSLGLTPKGLNKAEIPPQTLMSLLKKSKASLVIPGLLRFENVRWEVNRRPSSCCYGLRG